MDVGQIVGLGIGLILLITLSSFFSASETAITSSSIYKVESHYKKKKKNKIYKIINRMINNYQMTLGTILIGNTIVNVVATIISTLFFQSLVFKITGSSSEALITGLSTGVMTFLILIFGEYLPKAVARKNNIAYLKFAAIPLSFFYYLLFPLNFILNCFFKEKKSLSATEEELDTLVNIVKREGGLESHEAKLVTSAFKFDDKRINAVMTKIEDVKVINSSLTKKQTMDIFLKYEYSRMPFIRNNKYIGILKFKEFFKYQINNKKFNIDDILDPIIFISQYSTLDDVLQEMQVQQTHMAIVKKNNNSNIIVGIVTLENILEQLVGKLYDEDDENMEVTMINNFTWKVRGDYNASKFMKSKINKSIVINKDLSIEQWIKKEFKIKNLVNNFKTSNDFIKILFKKDKNNNKNIFIIEKKEL